MIWVGAGAVLVLAGGYEAGSRWRQIRGRGAWSIPLISALLVLTAILGAVHTPVIDGRPVVLFGDEAKAYRLSTVLGAQLRGLQELDELLVLDLTQGRFRQSELEEKLQQIETWYLQHQNDDLPAGPDGGLFTAPTLTVKQTLGAGINAAQNQRDWLITGDSAKRELAEQWRTNFMVGVLESAHQLKDAAAVYGIRLGPNELGAVE